MYIPADKSTNFYKMEKDSYNALLKKNVTSDYKKTDKLKVDKTNARQKEIVASLDLEFLQRRRKKLASQSKITSQTIKMTPNSVMKDL